MSLCHDSPGDFVRRGTIRPVRINLKRLPRWLRILLAATVLVVIAGLIVPYFFDADRYRSLIITAIESETGRKVRIGKIRSRLLPSIGFVAEDFGLSNPPGFADGDVLEVEAIRGNLAWGSLLHRQFHLSSVELVRPKFVLLEDDRGQTNYGRSPERRPGASSRASPKASGGPPSGSAGVAEIDRIKLTDAELILARLPSRARDARAMIPTLRARKIHAQLTRVTFDPEQVKQWAGNADLAGVVLELPAWKSPFAFRSGHLELRQGRIESEFRMSLGKAADFKGSVRVPDLERAMATFDLSTSELDVDQLLADQAEPPHRAPSAPRHLPSELVAQGRLAADRLLWKPYEASRGVAEVRIFTDRAEIWPLSVQLYGGMVQISARADRTQSPERFSTNVQIRNLNLGAMLAASPSARGKLSGTAEMNLQLFGSLGAHWQRSLSGTGQFTIRDGRLPGINLSGALESPAQLTGVGGETPFNLIQADLSIGEGRIRSQRIHMDSPRGTADLRGSCSLDGVLDYDGQIVLDSASGGAAGQNPAQAVGAILGGVLKREGGRVTVPTSIRGTLQDPKFLPGRGALRFDSPSSTSSTPQPAPTLPEKGKSILDIFRRP